MPNIYKIVPLSADYASAIKTKGHDDFGREVVEMMATGYGPCRVSLKPFEVGVDRRLLLSYSPFDVDNAFNQSGPIFIHKRDVAPYSDIYTFPKEIKADKVNFPLTLIGYSADQRMVLTQLVGDMDVDQLIADIFSHQAQVSYLHVRNAEASCYICRVDRV